MSMFGIWPSLTKPQMPQPNNTRVGTKVAIKPTVELKPRTKELIDKENIYCAHNYHPMPVVLSKGKGVFVWDVEGKRYFDFLSAYSATNQGHCHPKIVAALNKQNEQLTLSSRAFYNDKLPEYCEMVTKMFGYDRVLPMNTGAEGVETAIKLAKKWGKAKKRVVDDNALIISFKNCFHGRTAACISLSTDPSARDDYEPHLPGIIHANYGDADHVEQILNEFGKNVVGLIVEPIQGEAGVIVPPHGFLTRVKELCEKHNVLFIADEIQTGLGRTGKLLAVDWEGVRPDLLILGKALSGGTVPVSAVLGDNHVMLTIKPGEHGSTYGGNPSGCIAAIAALRALTSEKMVENAEAMGQILLVAINELKNKYSFIKEVRGRGLFAAIEVESASRYSPPAIDICTQMQVNGLLAKPTHEHTIRLSPPLVIKEDQLCEAISIMQQSFAQIAQQY